MFLLVLTLAAGCSDANKPVPPVDGKTMGSFRMWRSKVSPKFTAEQWKEFDLAVQEIRMRAMSLEGVSGPDAIDEVLLARVGGRSFDDVVRLGWEVKLERLESQRAELQKMVDANAMLTVKPGDADSADALERRRRDQVRRLETLHAEIVATQKRVAELGGNVEFARKLESTKAEAALLPRAAAVKEAEAMMERVRTNMALRFGARPVDLDADGQWLKGAQLEEFRRRRSEAASNGHTVMAVRVKGTWRIFDDVVTPIDLPPAVGANLTDEDRRKLAEAWVRLQINVWANQQALAELQEGARE